MKFAVATIFTLALAMSVECSIIALGHHSEVAGHGLAYTAVSGPAVAPILSHVPHASVAIHAAVSPLAHVHAAAPWGGLGVVNNVAHGGWGGAWDDGQWHGEGAWDGAWGGHGHGAAVVVDGVHGLGHGGALVVGGIHGHGHEGSYIAKTRGAAHAATLSGHAASVASINVAPAPGTV